MGTLGARYFTLIIIRGVFRFLMINEQGQLVEIPAVSPLYSQTIPADLPLKEKLYASAKPYAYSLFDGFLVGAHSGFRNFRLGQRKGISVGGKDQPLYVIGIDEQENRVFVGEGSEHPGLWTEVLVFGPLNQGFDAFKNIPTDSPLQVSVSSNSLQKAVQAQLYIFPDVLFLQGQTLFPLTMRDENVTVFYQDKIYTLDKK